MSRRDVWHGVMCDVRLPRQEEALWLAQGVADKSAAGTVVAPRGLGGRGGRVSLSLDSDREVLKLYMYTIVWCELWSKLCCSVSLRFSNAALKIGLEID